MISLDTLPHTLEVTFWDDLLFLYGKIPGEMEAQSGPTFCLIVTKNHPKKWVPQVGLVIRCQSYPTRSEARSFCSCPARPGSPPHSSHSVFSHGSGRILAVAGQSHPSETSCRPLSPAVLIHHYTSVFISSDTCSHVPALSICQFLSQKCSSSVFPWSLLPIESSASKSCREAFLDHPTCSMTPTASPSTPFLSFWPASGCSCFFIWVLHGQTVSLVRAGTACVSFLQLPQHLARDSLLSERLDE